MADVIVLGAGAAGLAAAAGLERAGRSVLLLEARERIGGRVWSRDDGLRLAPVELGAEFIHGEAPATRALMQRLGVPAIDAPRSHWMLRGARLGQLRDPFSRLQRALQGRSLLAGRDVSFETLLARLAARHVPRGTRAFARLLVEGFDAADPALASARDIVAEWRGGSAADAPQFRPAGGYGALLDALAHGFRERFVRVQLQSVVEQVRWRRGRVEVLGQRLGRPFRASALRAIVTLPLGVLQAPDGAPGAVRFTPPLTDKRRALDRLGSGPVLKITLRFRTPFWEQLEHERYRDVAFFHDPRAPIPTFWTSLPLRTSSLVAWAGGPRAARLAGLPAPELVEQALASLRDIFGPGARAAALLDAAHVHDWSLDPFARGAYSYVRTGGQAARRTLAAPLRDTLFFAGEATDAGGDPGTVEGALRSGARAAREAGAER